MALAGRLGLEVDLDKVPVDGELDHMRRLFSESTGRFVVTVDPRRSSEFEQMLEGIPWACLGRVTKSQRLTATFGGQEVLGLTVAQMRTNWRRRFGRMV
jgi:phosphoribosylformylglycinamidine synthase